VGTVVVDLQAIVGCIVAIGHLEYPIEDIVGRLVAFAGRLVGGIVVVVDLLAIVGLLIA